MIKFTSGVFMASSSSDESFITPEARIDVNEQQDMDTFASMPPFVELIATHGMISF